MQFAILAGPTSAADNVSLLAREEAALRAAAENVAESVVQIRTIGGLETVGGLLLPDGPTTGLVISADGYIVSSAFNFVHQPTSILVTFASGKQAPAELVATDHSRLLVLLKVSGVADLPVPPLASAEEIHPGQWAVAVGRTFRTDRVNVSVGIVSAVSRMFGKVIQTDAAVSTANYGGPLVDLRGRVLGLIVPMAPQGASEVAGVEWYDSGIGFAVPLASIADRIEAMKKGEDQRPGLLGIGMAAGNAHALPAKLAAVRPDSPAGQAGLKKDDRIVEVDGKSIRTQTDLRFALSPRYAGETVRIVATRGDERLERTIALVGELPPFRHAYLGILPMRLPAEAASTAAGTEDADADETAQAAAPEGILVRMACSGSPAAEAGVQAGDRVLQIDETKTTSLQDAIDAMNNAAPGGEVILQLLRDGRKIELAVRAGRLPSVIPNEVPPAYAPAHTDDANAKESPAVAKAGETLELKLPEFPHQCKVYVPASHEAGQTQGVLLWLRASGDTDADALIQDWQAICDRDRLLLVIPTAAETGTWERTELEYLRRLIERVLMQYKTDRYRVVVYGRESGGVMAWLLGLSSRDIFRGVATSAAPLPRQLRVPPNEPALRLAIFAGAPPAGEASSTPVAEGLQKLADAGYAVSTTAAAAGGELTKSQREELARWIDTLDRF